MLHSRKLAVRQLTKAIREQISITDSALDKISTRASHMRSRLESVEIRCPKYKAENAFQDLMDQLRNLEGAITVHRKGAEIVLGAVELAGYTEAAEIDLAKQLEAVSAEAAIATGDAWEVDLIELEKKVEVYESCP
jgi:hypothetical protein